MSPTFEDWTISVKGLIHPERKSASFRFRELTQSLIKFDNFSEHGSRVFRWWEHTFEHLSPEFAQIKNETRAALQNQFDNEHFAHLDKILTEHEKRLSDLFRDTIMKDIFMSVAGSAISSWPHAKTPLESSPKEIVDWGVQRCLEFNKLVRLNTKSEINLTESNWVNEDSFKSHSETQNPKIEQTTEKATQNKPLARNLQIPQKRKYPFTKIIPKDSNKLSHITTKTTNNNNNNNNDKHNNDNNNKNLYNKGPPSKKIKPSTQSK